MRHTMLAFGIGVLFTTTAWAEASRARDDLLLAYDEDMSEHARYLAFAEQAEREGYRGVARLFRATAEAERIRGDRHAQALRRHGVVPIADVEPASVGTTRVNLVRTLAHEHSELRRGYSLLSEQALREGNDDAALSFLLARGAHEDLVRLYQEALRDLGRNRDAREELYVCRTCGHVARGRAPDRCPVSHSSADSFTRVD
jgi:rubrerythrin